MSTSKSRVVKLDDDITMTEVTRSDEKAVINRAYSVRAKSVPASAKAFGDMGSAETYFQDLVLQRLNPK